MNVKYVRSAMVYVSETWPINVEQSARLERTVMCKEGTMDVLCIRWMDWFLTL